MSFSWSCDLARAAAIHGLHRRGPVPPQVAELLEERCPCDEHSALRDLFDLGMAREPRKQAVIARALGVSRAHVQQLEYEAMRELRRAAARRGLGVFTRDAAE